MLPDETLALFNSMATVMVVMGLVTFILLNVGLTAPYGKYSLTASSAWGPGLSGEHTVPSDALPAA